MVTETEEKTKKNPTYQAINQTNAPEVKAALAQLRMRQCELNDLQKHLEKREPDIMTAIKNVGADIANATAELKTLIQQHGSYQDAEAGDYALIYERKTPQYDAEAFETRYPQFVPAVIVKAVNADALKGLIKGGLLSQEDLETQAAGCDVAPVITFKTAQVTVIQ